mgnify:CR=1 FL=1
MKDLKELTRPNIWALKPYSSARDEYNGAEASVFLDANENPYNTPNNRYPDPMQRELKNMIAPIKKVDPDTIFLGNGSDEAIDLVYRAFCIPGVDNVAAIDPTYGMYQVCADVNDVEYRKVLLDENYQFSADKLLAATDDHTKLVFLCSPNNPTGNNLDRREMEKLLDTFQGLVIIDEAYSDFSDAPSFLADLDKYPNLIVFQTFSKAWGCAAIRLGMAFASKEIISIFSKIKYPYNVNLLTQKEAVMMLHRHYEVERWVKSATASEITRFFSANPSSVSPLPRPVTLSTGRFSRQASTAADVVVLPIPISPMPSASAPELCARSAASIPIARASTA